MDTNDRNFIKGQVDRIVIALNNLTKAINDSTAALSTDDDDAEFYKNPPKRVDTSSEDVHESDSDYTEVPTGKLVDACQEVRHYATNFVTELFRAKYQGSKRCEQPNAYLDLIRNRLRSTLCHDGKKPSIALMRYLTTHWDWVYLDALDDWGSITGKKMKGRSPIWEPSLIFNIEVIDGKPHWLVSTEELLDMMPPKL
jgi:hypothetical protein